ncbi:hypothetical protein [Ktedonobacter racemifer]|uniref:Uncharacterized protein n=1 Tax=Ktedonobacter racemifer DSM 44963 TaxID=485913 RepID=D6TID4_KTERA|nr:hypothetical protein [Ktedonobacter racemifer]EFH89191.1 hypothetical protein Krac_10733 [Ktedonobacter racemifer DSM 44963]
MKALQKKLEQREKTELIAIIQQMLRQEPDVQWLLTTPLPTSGAQEVSLDPEVYRQQVLAAMAAGDQPRQRKRHEVERRLTAIKAIADGFVKQQQYAAALTIYEVLITEIITHYNDYQDEYIAFSLMLQSSIDGLDSCFAGEEDNQQIRLRVLQALFAIYRFYTDSGMDLDEDIPALLIGNTTAEEREIITTWVRDVLAPIKPTRESRWGSGASRLSYETLIAGLAKGER